MFVATKHKFSAGGDTWELDSREWSSLAEAKEYLCHGMYECSDGCRGVEIKRVARPPKKWLEERIQTCRETAKHYTKLAVRYENMLEKRSKTKKGDS
jgi:hypothetical protein